MGQFLTRREGYWTFVRRVPDTVAHLDRRVLVRQSTGIRVADDPRQIAARRIVDKLNGEIEAYWRGLLDGQAAEAQLRYDAARRRARSFGFDYQPAAEVAKRPLPEILARVEAIRDAGSETDEESAATALLGGEAIPEIRLSTLFDKFEEHKKLSLRDLSEDQLRKWRNPKKRAVSNLITVIGDKPIAQISRSDALDFRAWWEARVEAEELEVGTANKDIGHLNKMLREVDTALRLGLSKPFAELRIEGETDNSRPPFPPEFVQSKLLADGALDGLNDEARRAVYLIAETGLRLSEAVNLGPETIILDHEIPHVRVLPDGRRMKTRHSARDIPLLGVALMAMQAQPEGFPRYLDKGATLSATVNKYLGDNGLLPTEEHTLYSLRHTFEDRLTPAAEQDKLIASLMGHKFYRPKYGDGPTLEQKLSLLQRIAFTPPSRV